LEKEISIEDMQKVVDVNKNQLRSGRWESLN